MKLANMSKILFSFIALASCYPAYAMFRAVAIQKGIASIRSMPNVPPIRNKHELKLNDLGFKISKKEIKQHVRSEVKQVMGLFEWDKKPKYTCKFLSNVKKSAAAAQLDDNKKIPAKFIFSYELFNEPEDIRKFIYAHEIGHFQQLMTNHKDYLEWRKPKHLILTTTFQNEELQIRIIDDTEIYLKHNLEFDADKRAALALKSCKGGLEYFKRELKINPDAQYANTTHPSSLERIARLEQLQKEFRLQ